MVMIPAPADDDDNGDKVVARCLSNTLSSQLLFPALPDKSLRRSLPEGLEPALKDVLEAASLLTTVLLLTTTPPERKFMGEAGMLTADGRSSDLFL